jgi:glyoxylase-like metal-dependent hydrolase (beta-lactamase superfamily II)
MKLGKHEIFVCETGKFRLDGGAMFGVVPKVLWSKHAPADEKNRIDLALRCLLVKAPTYTCLIDVGMGTKWDEKQRGLYHLENSEISSLLAIPEPDYVLLTHLHFDHAGGLTSYTDSNEIQRNFPKSTLLVHEENLAWAKKANARERASYLSQDWEAYEKSAQIQLTRSKPLEPVEVLPDLFILRSDGHTHGQQLVLLRTDAGPLLFCGDLFPTSKHLRIPWHMGYDIRPLTILEEKAQVLAEAKREGWKFFFEHDASLGLCALQWSEGSESPTLKDLGQSSKL